MPCLRQPGGTGLSASWRAGSGSSCSRSISSCHSPSQSNPSVSQKQMHSQQVWLFPKPVFRRYIRANLTSGSNKKTSLPALHYAGRHAVSIAAIFGSAPVCLLQTEVLPGDSSIYLQMTAAFIPGLLLLQDETSPHTCREAQLFAPAACQFSFNVPPENRGTRGNFTMWQ